MEEQEIYILGVGHNTIVYIDLAESCGYKIAGLYHYNEERTGEYVHGIPIIDSNTNLFQRESLGGMNFIVSVGENAIRTNLSNKIREMGGNIPTVIHPSAIVSKYSKISEGVVIHANSVVQADASIGKDTVLSYNTSLSHTSSVGESCYIAFNATIGAYIKVHDFVLMGQSASLVSGKLEYVGKNAVIGAGAVVINNVEADTIVIGNPAKTLDK
ncbi:transferase [Flavobacterium tegetincola]|uniref:PglD-related sugar-binding protein n=1 Tax=Flavobacterium tegetincola TaxID=150172 RepID=UPI0003FA4015|nr:transferase [Flavobacterium tegetincola]